ncbi:DUF945 family protein [Alteromonas sp. C1M14]|uniref:DUF945 family protein n=1 Tax=Alteromonas sp. C1M14 TaxID=2841567 RepID=UPI001C095111|nr:DUF945 family protein [Alteromonas sp. C1M14]MBU2976871.1 YdgA family protein [Alteromonas sp. C1M14]
MKKGIVVIAGASALAAFGMWFTQHSYQTAVADALERNADSYQDLGIDIQKSDLASSFVSLEDVYTVTLTEQFFEDLDLPDLYGESFDVTINNVCSVYPFYMSCHNEISLPDDVIPEDIVEKINGFSYDTGWSFSPLTNSVSSYVNTSKFTLDNEGDPVKFEALTMTSNSDLAFEQLTIDLNWGGMAVSESYSNMSIGNLSLNADMTLLSGITYIGTSSVTVDDIQLGSVNGESFSADTITVSSASSEYETDKYDVQYYVNSPAMAINGGLMPVELTELSMDIRLFGLSEKALEMMNSFQNNGASEQEVLTNMLNEMGKNEPGFVINDFSTSVNGVPVSLNGEITFDSFTANDIDTGEIAAKSNAQVNASVGKDVASALPQLVPILEQYTQMGMATKDSEGNYTTEITIKDRTLSANGTVLQQF